MRVKAPSCFNLATLHDVLPVHHPARNLPTSFDLPLQAPLPYWYPLHPVNNALPSSSVNSWSINPNHATIPLLAPTAVKHRRQWLCGPHRPPPTNNRIE
jgi:hypothetical protein